MKKLIFISLLIWLGLASYCQNNVLTRDGVYDVSSVTDDTLIYFESSLYSSFTGSKGYYYVNFTYLDNDDGYISFGVVSVVNDTNRFIPFTSDIPLEKTTSDVKIGDDIIKVFVAIDGDTTWQVGLGFMMFPGEYPAIQYKETTADAGQFEYKVKLVY